MPFRTPHALLGWPVGHSASPAMHQAAFDAAGLHCSYQALAVSPAALPQAVEGLWALGFGGVNLTLPHKVAVLPLLGDRLRPAARALGAVNTLVRGEGGWWGDNTDLPGLLACLPPGPWAGGEAWVLGAGGAARAAVAALAERGAPLRLLARRPEAAVALLEGLGLESSAAMAWPGPEGWGEALARPGWLVQATSVGLDGEASPFPLAALASARPDLRILDLVYHPRQTALVRAAQALGLAAEDGRRMLVGQAEVAWGHWTGQVAPAGVMAKALDDFLAAKA